MQTEEILQTSELQKLSTWRLSLSRRRRKLEHLHQTVHQLDTDFAAEERDWEAEADRLAQKVISITQNDSAQFQQQEEQIPDVSGSGEVISAHAAVAPDLEPCHVSSFE